MIFRFGENNKIDTKYNIGDSVLMGNGYTGVIDTVLVEDNINDGFVISYQIQVDVISLYNEYSIGGGCSTINENEIIGLTSEIERDINSFSIREIEDELIRRKNEN